MNPQPNFNPQYAPRCSTSVTSLPSYSKARKTPMLKLHKFASIALLKTTKKSTHQEADYSLIRSSISQNSEQGILTLSFSEQQKRNIQQQLSNGRLPPVSTICARVPLSLLLSRRNCLKLAYTTEHVRETS